MSDREDIAFGSPAAHLRRGRQPVLYWHENDWSGPSAAVVDVAFLHGLLPADEFVGHAHTEPEDRQFDALSAIAAEVARQDSFHPGYDASRDSVFAGLKTAEWELAEEALRDAWNAEKNEPHWDRTEAELVQALAVGTRLLRTLLEDRRRRELAAVEADTGDV